MALSHPCAAARLLRGGDGGASLDAATLQRLRVRVDAYVADGAAELGVPLDSLPIVLAGAPHWMRLLIFWGLLRALQVSRERHWPGESRGQMAVDDRRVQRTEYITL